MKTFEFVSYLRRASVVVRQIGEPSGDVYVKGAPESMKDICSQQSCMFSLAWPGKLRLTTGCNLVPTDYEDLLDFYTHRGFRVIACATKHIQNLSSAMVHNMERSEAEAGLDFVGFIVFENKLKPVTENIIKELDDAGIRKVMCTGDNILTAISVARECSLIDRTAHCFIPHFVNSTYLPAFASSQY